MGPQRAGGVYVFLSESFSPAADAAREPSAAVSGLVIVSSLGALSGIAPAGPRIYLAMAQDGLAFRWMGAVHPRHRTPHLAILVQAVWSSVLVATDTYRGFFARAIYTEWLFFALMTIGLFRLRRRALRPAGRGDIRRRRSCSSLPRWRSSSTSLRRIRCEAPWGC